MTTKQIGYVFLMIGFLAGAFIATAEVDHVKWGQFAPCAGAMLVGLVLVRSHAAAAKGDTEAHSGGLEALEKAVASLVTKIGAMNESKDSIDVFDVHGQIDAQLMDDLNDFVESRESLIPLFGMQRYADIMSAFANGERNINRAWSASADGYIDEVWASLGRAEERMREAQAQLVECREKQAA